MRNYLTLLFCFLVCFTATTNSQEIETRFLRPSVSYLFIQPSGSLERTVMNRLKEIEVESKFNDHRIDFESIRNFPNYPSRPGEGASIADWQDFRNEFENVGNKRLEIMHDYATQATNPIMAKWFKRDNQGNLSIELLSERGIFTATDADAIEAGSSAVDRREMLGERLVDRTYIIVWNIKDVITKAQDYRQRNTESNNRTHEGYVVEYEAHAYKMEFSDSVSAVFWMNYWTDENNHDAEKVEAWDSLFLPVKHVGSVNGRVESTQPKDPDHISYIRSEKLSMNELLMASAHYVLTDAGFKFSREIDDFKARAPVYQTRPLSVKLGTKEGLYLDQRFFIYEFVLDSDGNFDRERKGVGRVRKIAENDTIAVGDSDPSILRQQGGSRLYQGMLIESHEDIGLIVKTGAQITPGNLALSGFNLTLENRISQRVNISGVHLGIGANILYMNNVRPGTIMANNQIIMDISNTFSGLTFSFWGQISKEIYITPRGNLYLNPTVGAGLSGFSFMRYDGGSIETYENYVADEYFWTSIIMPLNVGLGINLSPAISLEFKPGVTLGTSYRTTNSHALSSVGSAHNMLGYDTYEVFEDINKSFSFTSMILNIKFRF